MVTSSIKFAGTHIYIWVERGTVRVKCVAQEHNTMSPARARTRTARAGDERTNHEATTPPWVLGPTYKVELGNKIHSTPKVCLAENTKRIVCACSEGRIAEKRVYHFLKFKRYK